MNFKKIKKSLLLIFVAISFSCKKIKFQTLPSAHGQVVAMFLMLEFGKKN